MNFWMAAFTLWKRELVRFYRQPSWVVGAVGTALLFWLVLGTGIPVAHYQAYFLPGAIVMSVLFTCIFTNSSIIDDRNAGFLQSVMVAPVTRGAIVMGKILGGATLSTLQGLILLPVALTVGASFQLLPFIGLLLSLFLLSFVINAMGFWLAWKIESTPGFHTIMNMVLLPMWMASGAVFAGAGSAWMRVFMVINPFTYGVAGVRRGLFPGQDLGSIPGLPLCLAVLLAVGLLFYGFSSWAVAKTDEGK
jgi:ABC-2 type transport system permease protein